MITHNIIGYDISASSSKVIFAKDPLNDDDLPGTFTPATNEEVDLALQKAHHAWRIYRALSSQRRAEFLYAIADEIEALGDMLVNRIMRETAYSEARVLVERRRTVAQLRMFAEYIENHQWRINSIDHAIPGRIPTPKPEIRKTQIAIGPVIVFAASNFPLAYSTAGGDTASALAAGCPVIVKAHESHLGTNALVAEAIMHAARKTEMPDGVFSSLVGDAYETGSLLVKHPLTAAVGFTGSIKGGRALFDLGNQREKPIPVFAEMGSVNPIFLLPENVKSNHRQLIPMLVDSMTMTVGQFCTNPGIIVMLQNAESDLFITELSNALSKVPSAVMLSTSIQNNYTKGVHQVQQEPYVSFLHEQTGADRSVSPVLAKVDAAHFIQSPSLHNEVFGPFSLIVLCTDINEMLDVANSFDGQLTATIHSSEEEADEARRLFNILIEKAGRIIFNGVPTGVEVCESMTHGGPYPASTDSRFTAVGHHAIQRWLRAVSFQNFPDYFLPEELLK